jgi:hypothetical protein
LLCISSSPAQTIPARSIFFNSGPGDAGLLEMAPGASLADGTDDGTILPVPGGRAGDGVGALCLQPAAAIISVTIAIAARTADWRIGETPELARRI